MLALIDDDGCFGVWSFSVGGLSGLLSFFPSYILFVFQKLVVVESLLICERMLIIYGCQFMVIRPLRSSSRNLC